MIGLTTTYHKIKAMKKPIRLIQGGQGAGKNYAMAIYLLERTDARIITIVTDTYDNLKDGIITDYENIFQWSGLNFYDFYNKQDKILTWGKTKIQFRYIADHKQQAGKSKRRQILYINEGNKMGWNSVEHYISRSEEVFIDFNPDQEFWAHTQLEPKEDCEKIIVTFRDNEMCPESEVRYIESKKDDEEWYNVYGKGETGTYSERRVYKYKDADSLPQGAVRIPNGMDFGSSPDPTCEIEMWIKEADLYIKEVFCENNLLQEKLKGAERDSIVDYKDRLILKQVKAKFPTTHFKHEDEYYLNYDKFGYFGDKYKDIVETDESKAIKIEIQRLKKQLIIGDSSGKTELLDLKKHGYNVRGVKKIKDGQSIGIKRLQGYNIHVLPDSPNLVAGFKSWMRKIDKNGKIIPEPDGHEPDCLAAARYVMLAKKVW